MGEECAYSSLSVCCLKPQEKAGKSELWQYVKFILSSLIVSYGSAFCQLPAQADDPLLIDPANLTLQPPVINMFNGMPVQSGQAGDVLNRKQPNEGFNPR